MNRDRRSLLFGAGAAGAMAALTPSTVFAEQKAQARIFNEVDARSIGVVANPSADDKMTVAMNNSGAINNFFANAGRGMGLVLPRGRIYIHDAIRLVNTPGKNTTLSLRGAGIGGTEIRKVTGGDIVRVSGFFNYLGGMTLVGEDEFGARLAMHGIQVRGLRQPGEALPTKMNTFRNLRIVGCRVGIRVGHHSTLEGDNGDGADPDIVGNLWQNIYLERNRYGIVRDGQNILNDHYENLFSLECERNHVLIPHGGDFRCFTAQFGRTVESDAYPKIHANASSPILLTNVRSENGGPQDPQPVFLKQENTTAKVDFNQVVLTNEISDPGERIGNLQVQIFGGTGTIQSSEIAGQVHLIGGRWTQIASDVGSLVHVNGSATLISSTVTGFAALPGTKLAQLNSTIGGL